MYIVHAYVWVTLNNQLTATKRVATPRLINAALRRNPNPSPNFIIV